MEKKFKISNYNGIKKNIDEYGYAIIKDVYKKKELDKLKKRLLDILHYIHPKKINNLNKKYFQIKKYNKKLKGNFFDMVSHEMFVLKLLYKEKITDIVRKYFNSKVVFSGRPSIHIHDSDGDRFLEPHQETNQFARDFLFIWAPIYDANMDQGSISVYEKSHKKGYYKHTPYNRLGSSHLEKSVYGKFNMKILKVKSGDAVLLHSAIVHGTWMTKKKGFVKYILCDRFNPLQKIPYLKNPNFKTMKIPHFGVNYNSIKD